MPTLGGRRERDTPLCCWPQKVVTVTSSPCCLSVGADPNWPTQNGVTCLHAVAGRGYEDIVAILLRDRNLTINDQTQDGQTALLMAAKGGHKGHCGQIDDIQC